MDTLRMEDIVRKTGGYFYCKSNPEKENGQKCNVDLIHKETFK